MNNLTQKEIILLNDQKSHEELCVKKYTNYANQAQDPVLKEMFKKHAQHEQQHLNTINQILSGQVPTMGQQQSQQQSTSQTGVSNQQDIDLCYDLLATEKYISSTYDTAIFEFNDPNIRTALNHIQKEEQQHGEEIYKYLKSKGAYNVQ
ncbi:spore coat protein [Mycoplasmatota bacterium]|nr:spore coat protein [Mycoplasmatota bacterium]